MTMTPQTRAAKIIAASQALEAAVVDAVAASEQHGPDAAQTHEAWDKVEQLGATIHRQGRLLAGKKRGG